MKNPNSPSVVNADAETPRSLNPRPVSIWFLLGVIVLYSFMSSVNLVQYLLLVVPNISQLPNPEGIPAVIGLQIVSVGVLLAGCVGIFRRKRWGRWFGLLVLVGIAAVSIFGPDTAVYDNAAQQAGGVALLGIF
ncbi:MAG: hypothetical protein LBF16_02655 [Pseudomonadales bacterium]|jgi:hypothetical protein|nr:hypothetical protein [Pseudomonadales bacterium]